MLNDSVFMITETSKYRMNSSELTIRNAAGDDKGIYACYSSDTYTVYKTINIVSIECEWCMHQVFV